MCGVRSQLSGMLSGALLYCNMQHAPQSSLVMFCVLLVYAVYVDSLINVYEVNFNRARAQL